MVKSISNGISESWAKFSSLPLNGNRKLGEFVFSLWMRKNNSKRSISNKETKMIIEVFLSQKATTWGGFMCEFYETLKNSYFSINENKCKINKWLNKLNTFVITL